MARQLRILIVGGGIAGLATAYYARRLGEAAGRPVEVRLFEQSEHAGGKMITLREGGFVIEGGPDSFITTKPWAIDLCRELGLSERLIPTNPNLRATYVLVGGRLQRLPAGLRLVAPTQWGPFLKSDLISWPGKLRMAMEFVWPARQEGGDESVADFVRRRFGAEALERLGEPLMAGIYVADPERLSLLSTFPQFAALEHSHGSVVRGLRAEAARSKGEGARVASLFMSLRGGTAELVEGLVASLGTQIVRTGRTVTAVECPPRGGDEDGRRFSVRLEDGSAVDGDIVVLATPAPVAGRLLAGDRGAPGVSTGLAELRNLSSATLSLGYRRSDVPHALDGYGFVVGARETVRILACTWSSSKLEGRAPHDAVLLRAFVGGHDKEADVALADDALVAMVRSELAGILGIRAAPMMTRIFRWYGANPQYDVGHRERMAALEAQCPTGLYLVGGAYGGVGVPDCVRQALEAARRMTMPMVGEVSLLGEVSPAD